MPCVSISFSNSSRENTSSISTPCTVWPACNPAAVSTATLKSTPLRVRACVNVNGKGTCTTVANTTADGVVCEDGDLCTVGDKCENGACKSGEVKVCAQCFKCNPKTGLCEVDPNQVDKPCNDNNKCTENDKCTVTGTCVGTPVNCNDNNECTADSCDPATGCVHTKLTGTPCETGNKCTADLCDQGVCKQGAVNVTCPQCQACDPTTGTCKAASEGLPCEDGNLCTVGDKCENGTCKPGTAKQCSQCETCVADKGCVPDTSKNGQQCNDNNACTTGETCQNGVCTGGSVKTCGDCHACNPATGTCDPVSGTTCGMPGSGRTCCAGACCMSDEICCATGRNAGKCGRATTKACNNDNQCCSGSCPTVPMGQARVCA